MEELRVRYSPRELVGYLARLAGLSADCAPCRPDELISLMDWNAIPAVPSIEV